MSTIDTSPDTITTARSTEAPGSRPVTTGRVRAVGAWATTSDHKVIGRMFVGVAVLALVAVAVVGALLGIERVDGDGTWLDAGALPQLFVAYRVGLVYGVLVPLLLGLAVAVVPLQVGARALAFPRVAATGFWVWLGGLVLVIVALAGDGGPGGDDLDMVGLFLAGMALLAVGLAAAAGSVATTVLTTRAPGMRMHRVPLFSWSALVASIGLLLVLPVLVGVIIYLFVDLRNAGAAFGASPGVSAWLGFALTQPATYLFALPAVGLAAELAPVAFRTRMPRRGVALGGVALLGVAALSAVTQQVNHDVPWAGSGLSLDGFGDKVADLVPYALFTLVPLLGALVVLAAVALAAKPAPGRERPHLTAPFVFALLGLLMILTGMVGGALTPITDLGLQGTVFEEAALVYVVYGGVLAGLGGLVYWSPKLTGRLVPDKPALGLAGLGLIATVLASLPYYVAGFADQPAASGEHDYSGPAELWNGAVAAGHALMALVVLALVGLMLRTRRARDTRLDDDPWQAHTLEWRTTSPAPPDNFADVPTVMSPEPVYDLRAAPSSTRSDR